MNLYRLAQSDPRYGTSGHVIPKDVWQAVPYNDRALFDKTDENGTGYPYKVEVSENKQTPSLYLMQNFGEVMTLVMRAFQRSFKDEASMEPPSPGQSTKMEVGAYAFNIIYRADYESRPKK